MEESSVKRFINVVVTLLPSIKKLFLGLLILTITYEAIKFIPPYIVKLIIDNLFETTNISYILLLLGITFLVLLIMTLIEVFMITKVARGATRQQTTLLMNNFSKLLKLPLKWHENQNTGSLVSKMQKASKYVADLVWFVNGDILPSLVQLVLTGIVLFWIDFRIGLIYLIFTPIILYTVDKHFRKVQPFREKYHKAYEDSTSTYAQSLYNIQTVKDYTREEFEQQIHTKQLEEYERNVNERISYEYLQISFRNTLTNFVRVLTMGVAIKLVLDGVLTPGDLVFVFTVVEKSYLNLHRLGRAYAFMGDTYESLNRALKIQETNNDLEDLGFEKLNKFDIEFSKVNFSYEQELILKGVSFKIPEKKTTAIVGPSGSGKTTIVKLITRHYDITSGTINVGSKNIKDVSLRDLRKNIAFVSQHTEIFDRSIKDNIAYGNSNASLKDVIEAAKKANAHKFISSFKEGYNTVVGEKGVKLSGGQRQRISIARALLSNANIIIFDEATSSLDSESEREIQSALLKIKNKTVIIIAHRFSTIEHSDNIIVLKNGRVLEQGSHKNLSKNSKLYKKMRELQKLGEIRD